MLQNCFSKTKQNKIHKKYSQITRQTKEMEMTFKNIWTAVLGVKSRQCPYHGSHVHSCTGWFLVNFTLARSIFEEEPQMRKCYQIAYRKDIEHFLDWTLVWEDPAYCEWCHHPWADGPGCIESRNEQAMQNQPVRSMSHSSCLQVPASCAYPGRPWMMNCKP